MLFPPPSNSRLCLVCGGGGGEQHDTVRADSNYPAQASLSTRRFVFLSEVLILRLYSTPSLPTQAYKWVLANHQGKPCKGSVGSRVKYFSLPLAGFLFPVIQTSSPPLFVKSQLVCSLLPVGILNVQLEWTGGKYKLH